MAICAGRRPVLTVRRYPFVDRNAPARGAEMGPTSGTGGGAGLVCGTHVTRGFLFGAGRSLATAERDPDCPPSGGLTPRRRITAPERRVPPTTDRALISGLPFRR